MIRLKRRSEEVPFEGSPTNPILLRRTFVLSRKGELVSPARDADVVSSSSLDDDRLIWDEEWKIGDDCIAIEVVCSSYGHFFNLVYSPTHCTLLQVMAIEDLLSDYSLSLAGSNRDDYEQMLIHNKLRKYL